MRVSGKGRRQTGWDRLACLLAASVQLAAAAPCPLPASVEAPQPAAVHVVWGPLTPDGDPRVVHHFEHLLLNESPIVDCLGGDHGLLSAFTGPDTLHILWRGMADRDRANAVAEGLQRAIDMPASRLQEGWATAADEIAFEALLAEPSDSERLLQRHSPVDQRYRLHPRSPVHLDPKTALDGLRQAPVTTVIAIGTTDVHFRRDPIPTLPAAAIQSIEHPAGAELAWHITGFLDCTQRRALRAVLAGMAEVQGGTVVGWMGQSRGVMGIQDSTSERIPKRRIVAVAHAYDQAATRMTARRLRDPADRTWMGVGQLGLGTCPSPEGQSLSEASLRGALDWLLGNTRPPPGTMPPAVGDLSLTAAPRAAIWQAGTPPPNWDADPSLFYSRSPGGFVLEGERDTLAALQTTGALPETTPTPVSLDDPVEQGIVLAGAHTAAVPCRWSGMPSMPVCPTAGPLRIPDHHALFVVEDTRQPTLVRVDIVYALEEEAARQAADVLLGTSGPVRALLERQTTIRDARVAPEHSRSRLSFTVSTTQLAGVLRTLRVDRSVASRAVPVWAGPGPALDAARLTDRPYERTHHPEPSSVVDATAVAAFDRAPRMVMLRGSAEHILPVLESLALDPDRVLQPAQLRAEATSIQRQP